ERQMEDPPAGRRRTGAGDGAGDRRRPAADRRARLRRARQLYSWLLGAAPEMADRRLEERRHQFLQHVLELIVEILRPAFPGAICGRGRRPRRPRPKVLRKNTRLTMGYGARR